MIFMAYLTKKIKGFTFIEMVVVVFIIVILATITISFLSASRQRNRDTVMISDVSQLQIALSSYKRDIGTYPTIITGGQELRGAGSITATTTLYMALVPTPPTPRDGNCANYPLYTSYYYLPSSDYKNYCLFFCLGGNTGDITADAKIAMPKGIISGALGSSACPF